MQRTTKIAVAVSTVIVLAAAAILGQFGPAMAHDPAGTANDPKLEKFRSPDLPDGTATALVSFKSVSGGDAPGSPQPRALRIETDVNGDPASYAGAEIVNVGLLGKAVSDVSRISYKVKGNVSGGSPRLSVHLSNGTWAYLSIGHCQTDLAPTTWKKTRFFGDALGCTIYTSTAPGNAGYASTGTSSAWDALVAGEGGGVTIDQLVYVQDEGPNVTWTDDLRVGGVMFSGPNVGTHVH